jgi:hypothetical protein
MDLLTADRVLESEGAALGRDGGQYDLLGVLNAHGYEDHQAANVCIDPSSGANVVAFTSGFGDGSYSTYVGYDAAGHPMALATDFGVVDQPDAGADESN